MKIQDMGSGVFVFGSGNLGEMSELPRALATFKKEHPNFRVTAITTCYAYFMDELGPRGYVVNTEEK